MGDRHQLPMPERITLVLATIFFFAWLPVLMTGAVSFNYWLDTTLRITAALAIPLWIMLRLLSLILFGVGRRAR